MTNFKLIDKLASFAQEKYSVDDAAHDVISFIDNLYETNAENPDGEDFTSDYHCEGVIYHVDDMNRYSEDFMKELKAIIANHKATMKEFEAYIANRKAREIV